MEFLSFRPLALLCIKSHQKDSSKLKPCVLCSFIVDFKLHVLGNIHKISTLFCRILTMEAEYVECNHFMGLYGPS